MYLTPDPMLPPLMNVGDLACWGTVQRLATRTNTWLQSGT